MDTNCTYKTNVFTKWLRSKTTYKFGIDVKGSLEEHGLFTFYLIQTDEVAGESQQFFLMYFISK